ncbi:hypothetical protein SAMN02910291_00002 [Desulfovibrio desulfuricans]|uniref:Uncharacterized protein n=3 Tax=Desulfovibrio TaxID=872 RepID=A0AA94HQ48_DESDE|nr:hypothetical protein SAMN02910291_00002 [Desulfovibrio desulfuricans]SPD35891.1 Hypothetical protein DSVG11_1794 [Desulfovibrio sp. G11]
MHQGLFQAQMLLGSEAFAGVRLCCHVVALLEHFILEMLYKNLSLTPCRKCLADGFAQRQAII